MHEVPTTPIGSKKSRLFFNKKKNWKTCFFIEKKPRLFSIKKSRGFFSTKKNNWKTWLFWNLLVWLVLNCDFHGYIEICV